MYKFEEIVNISKLQETMEAFSEFTDICSAVLDPEGNILVEVGWQDICTKFHRQNPETSRLCSESDKCINSKLHTGEHFYSYTCLNGLIDCAAAVIIDGKHYANIFHGQFFTEDPDLDFFRCQAQKYGFDEDEYIEAVKKVPIISLEKSKVILKYLTKLSENLVETGTSNLKVLETKNQELRQAHYLMKTLFDNIPHVAIRIYDEDLNTLYWNNKAKEVFNFSEMTNEIDKEPLSLMELLSMYPEKDLLNIESFSIPIGPYERNFISKDGGFKYFYSTVFPFVYNNRTELILMDVDVTEEKRIEKELARLDQLNLVGEIAASIGHEVRNPMTTVRGYLQLFADKDDFTDYKEHFDLMIQELDRGNSIITEFLSLAKNKRINLKELNLNKIILALSPLIEARTVINNCKLKLELDNIEHIFADEKELRQLIINIVNNGIEAMPTGGCLAIRTYQENSEILLKIEDQGLGISSEILEQLGTPFLTTKEEGTGLGLAVCYSIAARHNANITVQSSQKGTTFTIRFKIKHPNHK